MITIIMIKKAILIKITFIYLRWRGAARQKNDDDTDTIGGNKKFMRFVINEKL